MTVEYKANDETNHDATSMSRDVTNNSQSAGEESLTGADRSQGERANSRMPDKKPWNADADPHTAAGADEMTPGHFRHRLPIQIRFNDVDRYGHVNNNAYFAFYDLGKDDYLSSVLVKEYRRGDIVPVVANINADFIAPIFYGDTIVMETRICHIGQKSFTLEQQAVNEKTGAIVCHCTTVMVCFSLSTQRSADLPASYRRAIKTYEGF